MPIPKADRIGWCLLLFLAALGLAMAVTGIVHAGSPPPNALVERLIAVQPSLSSRKDEPVDAREFAQAVADVSKGNRQWAAFLTTLASHESGLSDRIRRGDYKSFEGDSYRDAAGELQHKSWGIFQVQRSPVNAEDFGSTDVAAQVRAGSRMARGAFYQCAKSGVPFPLGAFRALGGRGCLGKLKGEEKRVATFQRILARLQ